MGCWRGKMRRIRKNSAMPNKALRFLPLPLDKRERLIYVIYIKR
ncbi:hypothetical protein [Oscillospiraceae bacterium]|nr:hypothetical protein [Oscillospiraceae bacterium]